MVPSFAGRSVELANGFTRLLVVHRYELAAASDAERARELTPCSARWALDGSVGGMRNPAVLPQIYHRLLRGPLHPRSSDYSQRVREAVLEAVERGVLSVLSYPTRRVTMLVDRRHEVLGPTDEAKSWIEIELVDDAGVAVPDEPYELVTGDGRTRTGTLDAHGRARVEEIDPGPCQVTFPRLHAWKAA
jgi:hypothetical protein